MLLQDFNIRTGTKFFADILASNDGDVLLSLGRYNGWFPGLTYVRLFKSIMLVRRTIYFHTLGGRNCSSLHRVL